MKNPLDKTNIDEKLISMSKNVKNEYQKTLITALNTGLAFLIAFYIRDTLKSFITIILMKFHLSEVDGIFYEMMVALIVVALCVLAIMFLSKWNKEKE